MNQRTLPPSGSTESTSAMEREGQLVEAAKQDPARFEALYVKYHEAIYRFVYQRMRDSDVAHDVTSQVFLKALTNLHRYEFRGLPFSSWLYRIALSESNQWFKNRKAERTVNVQSTQVFQLIEELEEDRLQPYHDRMIALIGTLPEPDLHLLEMRFFEQRPYREIGEILEITENNAKVRMHRILQKLKQQLQSSGSQRA